MSQSQFQLISDIWDSHCDELLQEIANKYHWYTPSFITETIKSYMPKERLNNFIKAWDEKFIDAWYNKITRYGIHRIRELGIKIREPQIRICAHCGKKFLESSIAVYLSKQIGFKILFCSDCYFKALYCVGRPTSMNKEDMLMRLADLAKVLECVPTASFFQKPDLSSVDEEKQISIIKALIDIPTYSTYVDNFGTWLKALISAGILEDGTWRLTLGTRCLANDGHECLSLAEKTIDDWLSGHNIQHEKEPFYPYDQYLNPTGRMRADWKVGEILIEYTGLMDEPEYYAKIEAKQELATKLGLKLIIISPEDILNIEMKLGRLPEIVC